MSACSVLGFTQVYLFLLFKILNIDCRYSFDDLSCTHNQCFVQTTRIKLSFFNEIFILYS